MGASFTGGSFLPEEIMAGIRAKVFAAMEQVILEAVENMKRFTETRGTANSGHAGRVDTRQMLEDIGGETFFVGVDKIVGRFGFPGRRELYYILQSGSNPQDGNAITGFKHYPDSAFIEADFAFRDSYILAIDHLIAKLRESL